MRASILAIGLVLLAEIVPAATAHADPPSRDRVRQMLSAIEEIPPETIWRVMGPSTLSVLIELYNDVDEPGFVRLRAVSVAAYYPSEACRTFLKAVAEAPGQSDLFIRNAVLALGRAFGPQAVRDVQPYLRHREPVVRDAAIRSLGRIGTPAAVDALRARMSLERDQIVRETLVRVLDH